ncbi:MAG TPA: permease-like cell division protein FtsX [Candidatus Kryptonia bacterium]
MSRLWFIIKEAFSGLGRAKLSAFFSILMVALSFTMLGSFYLTSIQAERLLKYLKGKVEVEAFLTDSLTQDQLAVLRSQILGTKGVSKVDYVSKADAAEMFKNEFGEDINNVLDFNPLPASFRIFLKDQYKNTTDVGVIAGKIEKMPGVENVKYRKALLSLIDKRVRLFYGIMSGFGGALVLLSIFLVYNSMRLAISHKKRIIDTMKLVGASRMFVRLPFLLGGMIQGFTGGLIAAGAIYGVLSAGSILLRESYINQVLPPLQFYLAVIGIATLLGLVSTLSATRKYIKESLS